MNGSDGPMTKEAMAAHEAHRKYTDGMLQASASFALAALKAPGLMGAAGVGAMLAFVTANRGASPEALSAMGSVIFAFGIAVLAAAVATGFGYLAQLFFANEMVFREPTVIKPYVQHTPKSKKLHSWAMGFQFTAATLVVLAYLSIGYAIYGLYTIPSALAVRAAESAPADGGAD